MGTTLGASPAVRALDQFGNGVGNLGVTFAVTGGAGSVIGATPTTNGSGIAAVGAWTLDTLAGGNALTASAGALSAGFTATGLAAAPNRLLKLSGDGQTGVVNTALPVAPTVRLSDRYGNAVAGDTIDFFIQTDGGSVATPSVVTDAVGAASAGTWTIADFLAQNRLQAVVRGIPAVPAVQFTAQGTHDVAFQILRETVDTQTAIAGQPVSTPPAVRVRDQYFNPVPGVAVAFSITGGAGNVTPASVVTDSTGLAQVATWSLGLIAGLNTLEADVPGLTGSPIGFSANGVTTTATSMELGSLGGGNAQTGVVGTVLPTAYEVRVLDGAGAPVQSVQVAWAVGAGGGSVSSPTSLTDVNGIASVTRMLGVGVGTQTATASVNGLIGSPLTFSATALADVPAALVKQSADPQTATVATLVTAPVVQVTDQFGNLISGIEVSFAVAGGAIGATLDTTDAAGSATAGTWTLGSVVGTNTVTVTSAALPSESFTATGTAAAASVIALLDGNSQSGTVGQILAAPYRVHVTDAFGNDVSGATVHWSIVTGGTGAIAPSTVSTDGLGVAAATHTLGTTVGSHAAIAWITGLPDTVTFTSTALAGAAAFIAKAAGDLQSATVNTAVATRPTVLVTDQFGAPVAGQSVTWGIATGGGALGTPTTVTSDALGIATAPVWTVGTGVGTNSLTATASGLSGSPVTFTATGTAGAATQMVISAGNGQSETVGTVVSTKPAVVLKDQFNNLVPGVSVTFLVTSGGGSATGTGAVSSAQGVATVGSWTLGTVAGPNTLRASAPGVTAVTFGATGLAGAPVQLAFVPEPSRSLAGDTIAPPVRVAIQDQFGNTVLPVADVVHVDLGAVPTPGAKLVGTMDMAAVNGVAVFPDLAIDSAGIGYTLLASTPKIPGSRESARFDVGGVIAAFADDRLHPVAAAFNPVNGFVYVPGADQETQTLGVLDPGKGLLTLLPILQTKPFGVAVNAQTNRIYVTTFAVMTGAVVVIDGRNDTPIGLIPLSGEARGIAIDESTDRAFVAIAGDPSKGEPPALAIIDGKDNRVAVTIPFPEGALAGIGVVYNPNDRFVYVAIPNVGVGIFDPDQAKFVGAVSIVGEKGAAGTYGVAIDTRSNLLFATNRAENTVSVINLVDSKELTRLPVGREPEGLGVDGDRSAVYVANSGENTVSFIEIGKLEVIATLIVGPAPKAAAVNLGNGQFYVPTFGDSRVRMVQP